MCPFNAAVFGLKAEQGEDPGLVVGPCCCNLVGLTPSVSPGKLTICIVFLLPLFSENAQYINIYIKKIFFSGFIF